MFAFLAVVFAGSFVFLGVGSGGSALTDFLNGNIHLFGSGGGPSVESVQKKVDKDPTNPKLRLQLAQLLAKQSKKDSNFDPAIAAYNTYLKMKPRNQEAMQELANVYADKVNLLKSEVASPPIPPLAALQAVKPISSATTLGTALDTLLPTTLSQTTLQAGEAVQLQKEQNRVTRQHIAVYKRMAALNPGDSSAFLAAADAASKDGDTALQISLYKEFLKKYPGDPLVPDIKRNITQLEKQQASGQSGQSSGNPQTIPGASSPTG